MQKYIITRTGNPEVLQLSEVEEPVLDGNKVLIDIKAVGLNWSEVMIRRGEWPLELGDGFTPGAEASGLVEAVGPDVTRVRPGDRVAVFDITAYNEPGQGTYSEKICVSEDRVLELPGSIGFAEGAALPMALLTSYDAMIRHSPLPETGNVVVTACTGAVGIAGIKVARMKGLRVIATTRSETKRPLVAGLGVDVVVADKPSQLKNEVADLIENNGIHYVFDPIGGDTASELISLLGDNGTLLSYGSLSGKPFSVPSSYLFNQNRLHGYVVLKSLADPAVLQAVWQELLPMVEEFKIPVAQKFNFEEASEAHHAMESGGHFGKLVLVR